MESFRSENKSQSLQETAVIFLFRSINKGQSSSLSLCSERDKVSNKENYNNLESKSIKRKEHPKRVKEHCEENVNLSKFHLCYSVISCLHSRIFIYDYAQNYTVLEVVLNTCHDQNNFFRQLFSAKAMPQQGT